jgi:hypothetical protein
MPTLLNRAVLLTLGLSLSVVLQACGRDGPGNTMAAAPGSPSQIAAATGFIASADPTKTGEAYAEELEHNPTLFEKQKQICHGNGASFQPTPELQSACSAWDIARRNLEVDQTPPEGGVRNTGSL